MIKILSGKDITDTYKYPSNYTVSSMTGTKRGEYTRIYEDNPNKVKMIAAYNSKEEMIARALLWVSDNDYKICDGIYGSKEGRYEIFMYCKKHDIKTVYGDWFRNNYKTIQITLDFKRDTVPFIDTFTFGRFSDNYSKLTLQAYLSKDSNIMFDDHDGFCYELK